MTVQIPKQLPLALGRATKGDTRTQFAALPFRYRNDHLQVLLITSRRRKRWIVPKGWPMDGMRPSEAAMTEAWEEAGVVGRAFDHCLGLFSYNKMQDNGTSWPCLAMVYPVLVRKLASDFPERKERRRKWFTPRKAAKRVSEPELAKIISTFDPRLLR